MSTPSTPSTPSPRPRPVLYYTAFMAAASAFLGFAGLSDLMPKQGIAFVALAVAVLGAGGGVLVQGLTTPVSNPQDARGVPLVPVDTVPPAAPAPVVSAPPTTTTTAGSPLFPGLDWTGPGQRPD